MWHIPIIPALTILRQEDYKFEIGQGYIVSLTPAWATEQDTISKNQRKKYTYQNKNHNGLI